MGGIWSGIQAAARWCWGGPKRRLVTVGLGSLGIGALLVAIF